MDLSVQPTAPYRCPTGNNNFFFIIMREFLKRIFALRNTKPIENLCDANVHVDSVMECAKEISYVYCLPVNSGSSRKKKAITFYMLHLEEDASFQPKDEIQQHLEGSFDAIIFADMDILTPLLRDSVWSLDKDTRIAWVQQNS
ncbi:hypothetical protein ACFE04_000950 [Oxalis oulophora]